MLLNLGVAAYTLKDLRLAKQDLEREPCEHDGAIVNGCLRSPSATRLSGQIQSQTQRFCVPASQQVCLYRSNQLKKSFTLRTKRGARLYYNGLAFVCQDLTSVTLTKVRTSGAAFGRISCRSGIRRFDCIRPPKGASCGHTPLFQQHLGLCFVRWNRQFLDQ